MYHEVYLDQLHNSHDKWHESKQLQTVSCLRAFYQALNFAKRIQNRTKYISYLPESKAPEELKNSRLGLKGMALSFTSFTAWSRREKIQLKKPFFIFCGAPSSIAKQISLQYSRYGNIEDSQFPSTDNAW